MKRYLILLLLLQSLSLFCSCQKETWQVYGRYYAPTIFVNGQEHETMLTTDFATLDIIQKGDGTADVSVLFQGPEAYYDGIFTITSFQVNLSGISCEGNNSSIVLNGNNIESELSYKYANRKEKNGQGSIIRNFHIEGSLDKRDRSKSNVTISSKIFDKEISFSFSQMTKVESEAEFGIQGYPGWDAELVETRFFKNNTDHTVTVEYQSNPNELSYRQEMVIAAHEKGEIIIINEGIKASFVLTFDDGRISRHDATGTRYEYTGLPFEVVEKPYISFNYGHIYYNISYKCTYTITPEIYEAAQ